MPASGISSTSPEQRQLQIEEAAEEAAVNRARISRARLRQQESESATEYGRALFRAHGEAVALSLEQALGKALTGQLTAGPYHSAIWQLLGLGQKGPRSIAGVALGTLIDRISKPCSHRAMAGAIGRAIEAEIDVVAVEKRGQDLLKVARGRHGKRLAEKPTLRRLRVQPEGWTANDRFQVGAFLLEIIISETHLVLQQAVPGKKGLQLLPTPALKEIIAACPPTPRAALKLPMLVRPKPWAAMYHGGHLRNREPLVRSRSQLDLSHLTTEKLQPAFKVVNALQRQELQLDPWLVAHQRIAWDANIRGLFPVLRDPAQPPPKPAELVGPQEMARWRRNVEAAHRDRVEGAQVRRQIESSMRQAEQLAGEPIWFSWCMDMRGRLYTANHLTTHQGPDHEKAQVVVANARPCDDRAADWLFKAAAIHWGVKGSWAERLQFGRDQLDRMLAAAEDPLERAHLWRDAKDPWQFLGICRAMQQWLQDPSQPIRQLVRLDQTTSGPGIIGALLRDRALARSCNMVGTSQHDLYIELADLVTGTLRFDLENGDAKERRLAGWWLERGITRSMAKLPVMSTVYGAGLLGVTEQLSRALDESDGFVPLERLERERLVPCRYLAAKFNKAVGTHLRSAVALHAWLRQVVRRCMTKNRRMEWTTPMGLLISLGKEAQSMSRVRSLVHGTRRWQTVMDVERPGRLSGVETSRAIAAHMIHSFDAALVWAMVCEGAAQGVTVLPNHDCFAVPPCDAEWLHETLLYRTGEMYRPDWITEISLEIQQRAGLKSLQSPPVVGNLEIGEIGRNPYLFS